MIQIDPRALLLLLVGCASSEATVVPDPPTSSPEAPAEAVPEFREATSGGGTYVLRWRPLEAAIPVNEHFVIEAYLLKADDGRSPVDQADVVVSAWMPDHRHGMLRRPVAKGQGDGRYTIEAMLFHMGGHWQLFFDVFVDGSSERVEFELNL